MNLNNYQNRNELFIEWILQVISEGSRILDVGANDGTFCPEISRIAAHAGYFAGVDPDKAKISKHPLLHARFSTKLEDALIPSNSFDCVYALYVLEHIRDDRSFLQTVARVLKPGGSFFFITPNGYHYFAAVSAILARLGIQERVLRMLRPSQLVGQYHYPSLYLLNRPNKLIRLGREFGFSECEFRYSENIEELNCYFPGPLRAFPWLWEQMVKFSGQERLLCNLMGRMVKKRA